MKTTLTQKLKSQAKKFTKDPIQEELQFQSENFRSNRSLLRFTNTFENEKKLQTL